MASTDTLTLLKADIANDISRSDLTTEIAAAISKAIEHYQTVRFYFNETRGETFSTVADQPRYSSADDAAIPTFVTLDGLVITVGGQNRPLSWIDPLEYEVLVDNSASTGQPYSYTYYDQTIGLYPIPSDAYTVRMLGHIKKAAPATDGEANNVWMTEAYDLIRARATKIICIRPIKDRQTASDMAQLEMEQLERLKVETSKRIATGCVKASDF